MCLTLKMLFPSEREREKMSTSSPFFPFSSSSNSWSQRIHVFLLCFPSRLSSSSLLYFSRQIQSWSLWEIQWQLCWSLLAHGPHPPFSFLFLFQHLEIEQFVSHCRDLACGLLLSGNGEFWERFGEPNLLLTTVTMFQRLDRHVQRCLIQSVLSLLGLGREQQIWSLSYCWQPSGCSCACVCGYCPAVALSSISSSRRSVPSLWAFWSCRHTVCMRVWVYRATSRINNCRWPRGRVMLVSATCGMRFKLHNGCICVTWHWKSDQKPF